MNVRGALEAIRAVSGLTMLILLAACNNLLAGVSMALMDAYGLELVSVQAWGVLWGGLSLTVLAWTSRSYPRLVPVPDNA